MYCKTLTGVISYVTEMWKKTAVSCLISWEQFSPQFIKTVSSRLWHHFVVTWHIVTVVRTRNNVLSTFVSKSTYNCSCFMLNSFQNETWPQIFAKYQALAKHGGPGSVSVHVIFPILQNRFKTIVWRFPSFNNVVITLFLVFT